MKKMTKKTVFLHTTASGNEMSLDVFEYLHDPWWPTYYIQAGLHGIELIGTPVIYEFINYVEQHQLSLNLILVPIANPFSTDSQIMWVQTWYNNIHTNQQNCYNYNRLGQGMGQPFEDNIIQTLLELSQDADIVLDLHCAWWESVEHVYCHTSLIKSAKQFGIPNIISWDQSGKAFEDIQVDRTKQAFTLELWPSRILTKTLIHQWLQYLQNFIFSQSLWSIDYYISSRIHKLFSKYSWFLVWDIDVWDEIQPWDLIGQIYTKDSTKNLVSDFHWKFLIKNPIHAVYLHQELWQFLLF